MKLYPILFLAATLFTLHNAHATTTCRHNALGDLVCTDDGGYRSVTREDALGNYNTEDNQGNNFTCRQNALGDYVCD